ncbi:MAG: type II secretion system F family protein [Gammaproteobacteria bacterium]|nr:type II secretion system F family protein [Gammaproteobacteria bacterium]
MGTSEILTFGGLVFLAVFLLSQGLVLPVMGESKAVRKRLKQRLNDLENNDDEGITSLLRQNNLKRLSPFERRLEELPWLHRLGTVIEQSGNNIPAYRLVAVAFVLSLVGGAVCWQLTHALDITPLVVLAGFALPFMKINRDRGARFAKLEEQLPDAIDTIQRALKAGHPFSATLKMVAEDMDQPIAREFELTFADINYGNDLRRAMIGLLARVPSMTVMAFVTSVLVQKETGGNLAEILRQISEVVRSRFRFSRRVRSLSAEGRMSAWVLAMIPLLLFGIMMFTNPDYLPIMFKDPLGQDMITFAAIWSFIGIYFIRRIIRIDV